MTARTTTTNAKGVARAEAMAGLAAWQRGETTPAEALRRLWPVVRDAADHSNLGALLRALHKNAEAETAYRRAIALDPGFAAAPYNLGNLLADAGRLEEAEAAYADALAARPDYAQACNALATMQQRRGKLVVAVETFAAAAQLAPQWVEPQTNLGVALLGLERYDEAKQALQAAIAIDATHAPAHGNLGAVYLRAGAPMTAEAATRDAISLAPNEHRWITNLAVALQMQGRHAETDACYRRALELRPDYASGHGNLLFALNYRHDLSAEQIFAEYRAWDERHARALTQDIPFELDRTLERRLRVGFVSADFRQHAAALFAEPLLAALDRTRVEVFCYAEVPVEDAVTTRFRGLADTWRSTVGMSDDELAAQIRADQIDVLVDMAGHTAGNRLLVFARRPAPVQIAYLLGHGYSSGLSAMNAFLADDFLAPPGPAPLFSERVIRLPRLPFVYQPPAEMPPVAPLPAIANGAVTFGYFGRPERLNPGVIATWSRILHAIPGSRLVLNNRSFQERTFRELFVQRFAAHEIEADRLDLIYTAPQPTTWAAYNRIDIAFDPFPHNAGTTTIEALWQGVPVVTLTGRPTVGRFGAAILHAVGLDDWVTDTPDGYVARALTAATNLEELAALRAGMRTRLQASPLLDADGLARCVEQVVRELWKEWCVGAPLDIPPWLGSTQSSAPQAADAPTDVDMPASPESLAGREASRPPDQPCADAQVNPGDNQEIEPSASEPTETSSITALDAHLRRAYASGDLVAARKLAEEMLAANPNAATAAHVAALIAHRESRYDDADRYLRIAIATAPDDPEQYANHAAVLRCLGKLDAAEQAARAALALAPHRPETHNNLGNILRDAGRYDESIACYQAALKLAPDFADGWSNLAWVLSLNGRAQEAEQAARTAIRHDPNNANAHNNLGGALMRQSRLREAETALREALRLRPDFALPHSNILFCLNYRDDLSPEAIYAEYREWDARHGRPLAPASPTYAMLDQTPGRRLRVGYVSPDFRTHAVALFAEPLLAAHDRSQVEIFCYAEVPVEDATTQRFRALADHWRSTVGRSDTAVAEQIRQDSIDVLVELAGHTAGNRLLVFARKPAPVQVAYMIGHGCTSGLSAIDAFLADDLLAPPGAEVVFSEQLLRLPRIPLAYRPPEGMPPVVPLPASSAGCITFGYFGRTVRLNDGVIATWCRTLHAIPGSRLILNSTPFAEPAGREDWSARFAAHGIGADRVHMICTTPQPCTWEAYGAIDIALDPFPHNAGTTTIEALWQGVPVLTLAGRPTVGRFGAAILHAVNLDDWVTDTVDSYVARAVAAASNLESLAELRLALRPRMAASPLLDAVGLARSVEAAYRALWDEWREGAVPYLHRLYTSGDFVGAQAFARRLLTRDPSHADALHVLGACAYEAGDPAAATALLARAPVRADILSDLGVMQRAQGDSAAAEQTLRRALALDPGLVTAMGNLGNTLMDLGRAAEAESVLIRAVEQAPHLAWLRRSLALALLARNNAADAETHLRQALALAPNDPEAHETLGALLSQSGRPVEGERHHRAALPALPDKARCLSNLAVALQMQGRHAETEKCYRQALTLRPDYASGHGNLLFALNYRDDLTPEAIYAEYRSWDAQHAQKLAQAVPPIPADRMPGRRLRLGYVSPDFRHHAVALFAEPLLAAHDRRQVEVFCYAEVAVADDTTARFRQLADQWRPTSGISDDAMAAIIRADRIDVLIDLAGHTAANRLLVFARKPAPVQIEYILGHGYTSGMSAMDAFLADDVLAPPEADALFSEHLIRLPRIPLAYRPPADMPSVAPAPAAAAGTLTFGYFGRPERLNEHVVAAWSRILAGVPGSRLVLNSRNFAEAAFRDLFAARFAAYGTANDRLLMVASAPQPRTWAAYGAIDIALDPFPHNAGTTTIEALWLGVPVVTLAGRPTVGRFGASILHAAGLDDWVTEDVDAYVARAVSAASNIDALAELRGELRPRLAASPLLDATGLAQAVETACRALWNAASAVPDLEMAAE
ncbi:MAG TPA: tetratricopeptide repeat protein [Acetobacteraceae bacterium]|nr:tetratricopeptide repeat protein [Acetobacteraceae bacterium]